MTSPQWTFVVAIVAWVAVLSARQHRTWRAVLFLAAMTAILLVLTIDDGAATRYARTFVAFGAVLFAWLRGDQWLANDPRSVAFAEAYAAQLRRLQQLKRRLPQSLPTYGVEFDAIVDAIASIPAPSPRWQDLRDDTVAELRLRSERMRTAVVPDDAEVAERQRQWDLIEARFRRERAATTTFWARSPQIGSRDIR